MKTTRTILAIFAGLLLTAGLILIITENWKFALGLFLLFWSNGIADKLKELREKEALSNLAKRINKK